MDAIETLIHDYPLLFCISLVILEIGCIVALVSRRALRRGLVLAAAVALTVGVYLVYFFAPTTRNQILTASNSICQDVRLGSTDALEKYLDDGFHGTYNGATFDKPALIALLKPCSRDLQFTKVTLQRADCEIDSRGPHAWGEVVAELEGVHGVDTYEKMIVIVHLDWMKGPDGRWRIQRAEEPIFCPVVHSSQACRY